MSNNLHVKSSDTDTSNNNQLSPIYAFLYTLPSSTLGRIHHFPASCLAIFRLLPPLARLLVSHLLWIPHQLPKSHLVSFVRRGTEGRKQLEAALVALEKMHIILEYRDDDNGGLPVMIMDDTFRKHFRLALTGGGSHHSFGILCSADGLESIDIPYLDSYARRKWETILHFMVGSKLDQKPGPGVLYLLTESGLMVSERKNSSDLIITSKGFQFLLDEMNSQIWHFLIRYLGIAEQRNMDLVEILSFLFMLGGLELGRPYSAEFLTQTQKTMLQDLSEYGLIYQPPTKQDTLFFPTRIATTLTSSSPPLVSEKPSSSLSSSSKGQPAESPYFILLTTNYRLYAYTSNPLQIAVLNLFVSIKSGFSNFVVGMITRDSIKAALANGIEADQIISYLTSHAHPQMRLKTPILPANVIDQIHLWEQERMRTRAVDGYLYEDFHSDADFELVRDYAQQIGVLLWSSDPSSSEGKRQFVVTDQGHSIVREFIKRRMDS